MGLSSNILWHQTKRDAFFKILRTKEFLYSYSMEKVFPIGENQGLAIPMISMSDFPFSEIANNKWAYGDYAIGLTREWGIRNGFSPVLYCNKESFLYDYLVELMGKILQGNDDDIFIKCLYLFSYIKFVQDKLNTSRKEYINYRFYDERENRVVPDYRKHDEIRIYLTEVEYESYKREKGNSMLNLGVKFTWDDVKYLIVNSESNVSEIHQILKKENINRPIYIFTKSQVMEDFVGIDHHKEVPLPVQNIDLRDISDSIRQIERMAEEIQNRLGERRK